MRIGAKPATVTQVLADIRLAKLQDRPVRPAVARTLVSWLAELTEDHPLVTAFACGQDVDARAVMDEITDIKANIRTWPRWGGIPRDRLYRELDIFLARHGLPPVRIPEWPEQWPVDEPQGDESEKVVVLR
jgi:hypothetical protein